MNEYGGDDTCEALTLKTDHELRATFQILRLVFMLSSSTV